MLLTSSQVYVLFSTSIIITFTAALFLAGYILQQQTLHSLQAEIRPRVSRIHTRFAAATAAASIRPSSSSSTPPSIATHISAEYPQVAHVAASQGRLLGSPAPVIVAASHAPQQAAHAGQVDDGSGGGIVGSGWKSREKDDEEVEFNRGLERFEKEGEDFFAAKKKKTGGEQVAFGNGWRWA